MNQTKSSFEAYLKRVRESAVGKIKPKELIHEGCPICGVNKKPILKKETMTHMVPPYIWKGTFWVYECPKCKQRFTTDESDEISIATLKMQKL